MTAHDFTIQDGGSVIILHPCNDAARSFIDDHLYDDDDTPQWWGGGVVIEPRYLGDILEGIAECDLTIG